jgi:colanic acid/amylovoran biosynthesis glycosyltransferase
MKIAFLLTEFPSPSQTFVLNQITGMIDKGHSVNIFALESTAEKKLHPDIYRYGLMENVKYFPKVHKNVIERTIKGLRLVARIIKKNPKPVLNAINIFKYGKEAASFRLLYQILPFIENNFHDIIYCHFGPMGNIAVKCLKIGAISGKLVTVFHGYDLTSYPKKMGAEVYDQLFQTGDLCLPISNHWANKLYEMGCKKNKIRVHRMGVDTKKIKPKEYYYRINTKIRILSIARLVEKKGIEYAIEAISQIVDTRRRIEYLIIGNGPLMKKLENLVETLGLKEHVYFKGWMPHDEIIKLMMNTDIFLAPSITSSNGDQEGIPVVLMESLAMGVPVISTFHSGIPELVKNGVNGLLVPERDVEKLAESLSYLIDHPDLWPEMGIAGRKYVKEHYDQATLNTRLESIFNRILSARIHDSDCK